MQLASVQVSRYRSISGRANFPIKDLTVLVGPNNQGKSNLLHGINLGMDAIAYLAQDRIMPRTGQSRLRATRNRNAYYDWERDYPLNLKRDRQRSYSSIRFEFTLTQNEVGDFKADVGLQVNGTLPIDIRFGASTRAPLISIRKPGKGSATYSKKSAEIARFIQERIHFIYVPAVRTVEQSIEVIDGLATERLRALDDDLEYQSLIKKADEIRDRHFRDLEISVAERLRSYLENVSSIQLETDPYIRRAPIRDVIIDDGTQTSIRQKGDGVKSVVSLAMLHDVAEHANPSKHVILALEEPEAHLHPDAVHEIRKVVRRLSKSQQVIITTHSPILINRYPVSSNILVQNNHAHPTPRVEDLRRCLGVRPADNMTSASHYILVEGLTDARIFRTLLPLLSSKVREAVNEGTLVFRDTGGGNGVQSTAKLLLNEPVLLFAVVDGDKPGADAREALVDEQLIDNENILMATPSGQFNKELEDLLSVDAHKTVMRELFQADVTGYRPRTPDKKWSTNAGSFLRPLGKSDKYSVDSLKIKLAEYVEVEGLAAVADDALPLLTTFAAQIESQLD